MTGPAVPSGLAALLEQAGNPPATDHQDIDRLRRELGDLLHSKMLWLWPDMARLLVDMAAELSHWQAWGETTRDFHSGTTADLLARFEALNQKAGTA